MSLAELIKLEADGTCPKCGVRYVLATAPPLTPAELSTNDDETIERLRARRTNDDAKQ